MTSAPNKSSRLDQISLVSANFGNGIAYKEILEDWFRFLGGKPAEVVIVDGGSDQLTQKNYLDLYADGMIDKLQIISPHHQDNDKDRCFVQEYTAAAIASKPYLLFFKIDTLPYREGHDNWLEESIEYLDREEVFAVSGALNQQFDNRAAWDGWYFSRACTINFALMKRSKFISAMSEFAGDYISSGFRGEHRYGRFLLERALIDYMKLHKQFTLCKVEDPSWTIFHTNAIDKGLLEVRAKYLARLGIKPYLNPCLTDDVTRYAYYGKPIARASVVERFRISFGRTTIGAYWRSFKNIIYSVR